MQDSSIWARSPQYVVRYPDQHLLSHTQKTRYYTWAGIIDPQLYGDSLNKLTKSTEHNLVQLERCRQSSQSDKLLLRTGRTPSTKTVWHDSKVMFAPRGTLDAEISSFVHDDDDDDDVSSVVSVTGPNNFCYLCSTMEDHQKHIMRMRVPKKPRDTLKPRMRYTAPPPRVRHIIEEEPPELFDNRYKVVVWTGNEPDATTDAKVFITIKGDQNILGKTQLYRGSANSKLCFCRGSKETFFIKAPTLGNLEILSIEHDGLKRRQSWYCEKVEVTCMRTLQHWVFLCKNWLSLHHGDYALVRDLTANYLERKNQEYEVTVITGSKRMAGTDASVFVTIHGAEGASQKIKLASNRNQKMFQRNSIDKFHIKFSDIGELRSLRIEHDGTGLASGWFLDRVIMQNIKDPKIIYYFLLNGWLARDIGDGLLWREIRAKKKLASEITTGKPVNYQVTVRTGNVKYAGTDANVYIIIQGKKGKTKKLFMDDSRDNFERGMTEVFELTAMNTGPLSTISIGHDNSGPGAGWYCEDVTIRKYLTKEEVKQFLFKLKKKRKSKNEQKRRLSERLKEKSLTNIKEDDEDESETDEEDTENGSEGSYKDVFDFDGKVVKIPLFEEYYFVCKNWLATDEADGLLERELGVKKKSVYFTQR